MVPGENVPLVVDAVPAQGFVELLVSLEPGVLISHVDPDGELIEPRLRPGQLDRVPLGEVFARSQERTGPLFRQGWAMGADHSEDSRSIESGDQRTGTAHRE